MMTQGRWRADALTDAKALLKEVQAASDAARYALAASEALDALRELLEAAGPLNAGQRSAIADRMDVYRNMRQDALTSHQRVMAENADALKIAEALDELKTRVASSLYRLEY